MLACPPLGFESKQALPKNITLLVFCFKVMCYRETVLAGQILLDKPEFLGRIFLKDNWTSLPEKEKSWVFPPAAGC